MNRIVTCREPLTDAMVGGKFAKQGVMLQAGLPVPAFFCLTSRFFEEAHRPIRAEIEETLAAIDFADHASVRGASEAIQRHFVGLALAPGDEEEILSAFDKAFQEDALVSVRASTVGHKLAESEDSLSNPFAGMSESFLYVPRAELIERVKRCWASGFSQEGLLYRQAQGMDLCGFDVAVGVQRMVFGERSFVLFTADPKTAARDPVIVCGYGIGEGIVQERVGVDHYFVRGKTGEVRAEPGEKRTQLTVDPEKGTGLVERPVPEAQVSARCLSDEEVGRLVEMGTRIEALFDVPQDIEGTFTKEGEVFILQSRPIAIDYARQLVWSNTNVTESFPGVSGALTYTHARYFYRVVFYDLYRRLGVPAPELHRNFEPLDRMIGLLEGRVYYCLSHFYLLHKQSPLFPIFRAHWENMIGLPSSYQTHAGLSVREAIAKVRAAGRFAWALVVTWLDYVRHGRSIARFHVWWEKLIAPLRGRDLTGEDPYALLQSFRRVWTEVGDWWGVTLTNDAYLIPLYGFAEHLFKRWKLDDDGGLLSDLLCGDEKLLSVEIILSAVNLAERVRADQALAAFVKEHDGPAIWKALSKGELSPSFREAVTTHLHRFGDRGLQELKMEQPALRDTPWVLMEMVRQYASRDVTVESVRQNERDVRRKADERLRALLRGKPFKRFFLERVVLPRLRRLIRYRENSRYCRSELFGFSRNVFRGIGAHLVKRGVLRDIESVHHLGQDELFGYLDGTGITDDLQALADLRRKELEARLERQTPEHITTVGAVPDNALQVKRAAQGGGAAEGELRGLGSSAGRVRGRARVVEDPNTVSQIDEDMILVAKETDPGWLFLMLASKGMVVERGSMLSHTAITGRKFGIPTVVAVPRATERIPDGALLEIDGSSGEVTLLEEAAS